MRIFVPMVTLAEDMKRVRMIAETVAAQLGLDEIPPLGAMIETPAAALCVSEIAAFADFFSIGTNDLIQYTLAVDRANENVASLFTPANPALMRMIRDVIKAGRRFDVPVSLCGEMASQLEFCLLLLGLGLRQLSVAPQTIPSVKRLIRASTLQHAQRVARRTMGLHTDRQIIHYLRQETRKVFPGLV